MKSAVAVNYHTDEVLSSSFSSSFNLSLTDYVMRFLQLLILPCVYSAITLWLKLEELHNLPMLFSFNRTSESRDLLKYYSVIDSVIILAFQKQSLVTSTPVQQP